MYNDALFQHALALAALERVTAGGYRIAAGKVVDSVSWPVAGFHLMSPFTARWPSAAGHGE